MSETYSKAELVAEIAEKFDVTKVKAGEILDFAFDNIVKKAKKGARVSLHGFGTFGVRKRAARKGRNPKTGEEIKVKASKTLGFKPAKGVKDAL
jgi:nucleoid DNA-binding protein